MTGDLNSRIGHKPDFIVHDNTSSVDEDDYMPDKYLSRASCDNKCNSFGLRLIELCKSLCLRVVNGRLYHDFDVGAYTFVNNNGASVVDYLLTNECNFSCISDFYIHSLNEWSDHTPLSFSIRCKNWSENTRDYESVKHKWNASHRDAFRTGLLTKAGLLDTLTSSLDTNNVQSVNEVGNSVNAILQEVADPLFEKHVVCSNIVSFSPSSCVNNAEWFDIECEQSTLS